MEVIKTTPNLEFDVIYADGTRKRVSEGILYEAAADGDVIFHNGTSRPEVLLAAAETALVSVAALGPGKAALSIGMCCSEESRAVARDFAWFVQPLLEDRSASDQAKFRLGQMDMKASVVAMLRDQAKAVHGVLRSELLEAAELVQKMEVLHG